jgi:outer membrane lipoprotein-sorting protein
MNRNAEQQAEQLDAFLTARLSGLETLSVELDDGKLASELVRLAQSAQPDSSFARELEAQLLEGAREKVAAERKSAARDQEISKKDALSPRRSNLPLAFRLSRSRLWPRAVLAAAAIAAAVILFLIITRPPAVDAQEILEKAQAAANYPAGSGIRSFELHETSTLQTATGETLHTTAARWFQAPDHWRSEIQSTVTGSNGQELPDRASASLSITDGTDVWYFDQKQNSVTVNPHPANTGSTPNITGFGPQPDSLNSLFAQASSCFDPRVVGSDTVAGRATYIVDLGAMKCAGPATAETSGRSIIWVDKATFFVLKDVQYGSSGGQPLATTEITSIRYNPSLDAALFTFISPPGAIIQDFRPKPAPAADQFQQQLESLAKQAAYPILVPDYIPAGLKPRQPRDSSIGGIQLDFVPPEQVDKPSAAILSGLLINERQATYDLVVRWTEGAKPVQISAGKAWLRTDAPNPMGGGMDKAAYILRDGTLVSIASFQIEPEELVKVADSLKTVPGSHASLPNPTPPQLAQARQSVTFPVFIPTDVPAGLTPEPPLIISQPESSVEIDYHMSDGSIGLTVVNASLDCCSGLRNVQGANIELTTGVAAHLIQDPDDSSGGWTLWWEQDGATVKISGPELTRAGLIKIASSMDKRAELGWTEAPPVRPTPGPLPAPKFKILEPSWLPESMTRQQDLQTAPPEFGSWVALTFLPQGSDQPRTPLILLEKPLALVPERTPDPQATRQKIGSYDVTINRTARECWNYDWDVGDLHLSLANSFNVSGTARYTCEQMAKIVESTR